MLKVSRSASAQLPVSVEQEFIREMVAKVQTLRILLLGELLSGAYRQDLATSDQKSVLARVSDVVFDADGSGYEEQRANIGTLNRKIIPEDYRLTDLDLMKRADMHLIAKAVKRMETGKVPGKKQLQFLRQINEDLVRFSSEIRENFAASIFGGRGDIEFASERVRLLHEWRQLQKRTAAALASENWYSPSAKSTRTRERGPSQNVVSGITDYHRSGHEALDNFEQELRLLENREVLLHDSGMGAFHCIMSTIEKRQPGAFLDGATILESAGVYWEIEAWLRDLAKTRGVIPLEVPTGNSEQLVEQVERHRPQILILGSIANSQELGVTDVGDVLIKLSESEGIASRSGYDPDRRRLYLLVDDTVASRYANWQERVLPRLPSFISIVTFESMGKLYQDGMDHTQLASVGTSDTVLRNMIYEERRWGAHLPIEGAVNEVRCAWLTSDMEAKLAAHSRNALIIATRLEEWALKNDGKLEVRYPFLTSNPHYQIAQGCLRGGGPLITLNFKGEIFRRYPDILPKAFCSMAIQFARNRGIELNIGTAFGLNVTRLTTCRVVERLSGEMVSGRMYLRIAPGTEHPAVASELAQVFIDAVEYVSKGPKKDHRGEDQFTAAV